MLKLIFILTISIFSSLAYSQPFKGISIDEKYICAYSDTRVACWGQNDYGQVQVVDGLTNVKLLETAQKFGCAVDEVGMTCWGSYPELLPEMINSTSITKIQLSNTNVCALISGDLKCTSKPVGLADSDLVDVADFSILPGISCVVKKSVLICKGEDSAQLMNFKPNNFGHVVKVDLGESQLGFSSICVSNTEGQLFCWNDQGVAPVENFDQIQAVEVGSYMNCVIKENNQYRCSSMTNALGRFPNVDGVLDISVKIYGACLLDLTGKIHCWGSDASKFGLPPVIKDPLLMTATDNSTCFAMKDKISCSGVDRFTFDIPVKNVTVMGGSYDKLCFVDDSGPRCSDRGSVPPDLGTVKQIAVGFSTVCYLNTEGKVQCWGVNVGLPADLKSVIKLANRSLHFCALTVGNEITCWGQNNIKHDYDKKEKILDLVSGFKFDCALFANDSIKCWGSSELYDQTILSPPTHLPNPKGVVSADDFACVYSETDVSCWGNPGYYSITPPKVIGKIKSVTAGRAHMCLMDDEKVKCWGDDSRGQYQFFQE